MKENRHWSIEEDQALRQLREERGVKGWTEIAEILQRQFEIRGKSAKRCRERYCNYVSSSVKRDDWTLEEEKALFRLHNQKGNKWVQIGQQLERPDNAIKNHYHSKLRKALRKINKIIYEHLRSEFKPIKNSLLPKMLQTAEEYYHQADREQTTPAKNCYVMKNRILNFLDVEEGALGEQEVGELREFVREVNYFNKTYKKRRNRKDCPERVRSTLYKGKQIINLIQENQKIHKSIEHHSDDSEMSSLPIAEESPPAAEPECKQATSYQIQPEPTKQTTTAVMLEVGQQFAVPFMMNFPIGFPYHFYVHPYGYSL